MVTMIKAKVIEKTHVGLKLGLKRFFTRFGRTSRRDERSSGTRWYECDISSRGL
jgi:hypothetical protein